jgi:hypothetical protein
MREQLQGFSNMTAVLSIMLTGTCCFLWAMGRVVPQDLLVLTTSAVMFYLGQKATEAPKPEPLAPVFIPGQDD